MPDTATPPPTDTTPDAPIDTPPPAARPETPDAPDPIRELTRMAEQLARAHNRRLLYEYLRARRAYR